MTIIGMPQIRCTRTTEVAASGLELKRQRHRVADAEQIVSVSRVSRLSLPSLIDVAGPQTFYTYR